MNESNPIVEAQAVLNDLEYELQKYRDIWDQLKKDNPEFEPVSNENWGKKHAQCWLHGATELEETNELERWLFERPLLSDNAEELVVYQAMYGGNDVWVRPLAMFLENIKDQSQPRFKLVKK